MQGSVQYMADLRKKLTSPPKQGSVSKALLFLKQHNPLLQLDRSIYKHAGSSPKNVEDPSSVKDVSYDDV
ncbi:hypothetical protein QL285_019327 [Trifolium repens]|nr:hypothetical protein QL285_019327 [Trifolium repens]